jgi:hypothetical protein
MFRSTRKERTIFGRLTTASQRAKPAPGEIGDDEGVAPQPAPLQDEGRRNQVGGEGQEERAGNIENLVQGEVESRQISAVHAGDIVEGENRSEKHARG